MLHPLLGNPIQLNPIKSIIGNKLLSHAQKLTVSMLLEQPLTPTRSKARFLFCSLFDDPNLNQN